MKASIFSQIIFAILTYILAGIWQIANTYIFNKT